MSYRNQYPGINPKAVIAVRCAARSMVGKAGYKFSDVEDLEQELMVRLVSRLGTFNPSRGGFSTFVDRVVKAGVKDLLSHRMAQRRGQGLQVSSNQQIENSEDPSWDSIAWQGTAGIDGREVDSVGHAMCHMAELDLRLDVERAIQQLPKSLQEICKRLGRESQAEIAAEKDWPRIGLYRLVAIIRETFEEMGLGAHLGTISDIPGQV